MLEHMVVAALSITTGSSCVIKNIVAKASRHMHVVAFLSWKGNMQFMFISICCVLLKVDVLS